MSSCTPAYDTIAQEYHSIVALSTRRSELYSFFFTIVGDVTNKTVLDLACGSGVVSDMLISIGARTVVGVDISQNMLAIARETTSKKITYIHGAVGSLPSLGVFDVVTAAFLFHYASTKDELRKMFLDVSKHLVPDGRCIAINNNPDNLFVHDPTGAKVTTTQQTPLTEGGQITVTFTTAQDERVSFDQYFWEKRTYEEAAHAAGLTLAWIPILPTISHSSKTLAELEHGFSDLVVMVLRRE